MLLASYAYGSGSNLATTVLECSHPIRMPVGLSESRLGEEERNFIPSSDGSHLPGWKPEAPTAFGSFLSDDDDAGTLTPVDVAHRDARLPGFQVRGDQMTDVVLTLDISSSGVRARLHDRLMSTVAQASVDLPTLTDACGMSAQRFGAIQDALVTAIRAVADTETVAIEAIAASGTASSLAWASRDPTGRIVEVSDVLLWSDSRAISAWSSVETAARDAFSRTLCPPDASYWPAKLHWARSAFELDSDTLFAGGKDFVFEWLTGELWTDPMSAGSTGMLDSKAWQWDSDLLSTVGVAIDSFPQLHTATETMPLRADVAALLGLEPGIPVAGGGMDGPLTQIGACGFAPGAASCTIGTSIAFRANSTERAEDQQRRVWCYPVDREHWVVGGAGNNGGNVLAWMSDRFGGIASVGDLVASAFTVGAVDGLLMVPYLSGERAPLWRPDLRAAFIGLAAHHELAHLVRAAIDGIAGSLTELAEAVQSVAGEQQSIRFTGGFLQEPQWVQVMTDALGATTCLPDPDSATATGAAIIAWAAVEGVPIDRVFTPQSVDSRDPNTASGERLAAVAHRTRQVRDLLWPVAGR